MRRVGHLVLPQAREIALSGDWAWVAQNLRGMALVNVRRPSRPHLVRSFSPSDVQALDVLIAGPDLLAIADRFRGLRFWDISKPTKPVELSTVTLPAIANHLSVSQHADGSRYLYAACGGDGMAVVDITDPPFPRLITVFTQQVDFSRRLLPAGELGYLADHLTGGLKVLDLSRPDRPALMLQVNTPGFCESVALRADLLVCGYRQYGTSLFRVTPSATDSATTPSVKLLCSLSRSHSRVRDLLLPTESLLVLADDKAGVALYALSDPALPYLLSEDRFDRSRDGVASSLALHRGYLYVAAWDGGVLVYKF